MDYFVRFSQDMMEEVENRALAIEVRFAELEATLKATKAKMK